MTDPHELPASQKFWFAFLALFIIPISGLSIDIYVPSLPAVSQYFHVDKALAQLTVSTYMLGIGVMQLFAGSISDSFGRRKPFLWAAAIYIVSTLSIPFASNIYQLLSLRCLQGVVIAIFIVPMRSVISDLYKGTELYKMMAYMTIAWSIGPIVAPAIGGYLQHYLGWKANFYFLAAYSLLGFALIAAYLPETSLHRHPFHLGEILARTREILSHRTFLTGIIINGLLYSLIILFSIVGPFLIQLELKYTAIQFGHLALLIGVAWLLGTITNRLTIHSNFVIKEKICLGGMFIIALAMLVIAILFPLNLPGMIIPTFLLIWLGGIIFPNYFALAVALFPKTTASANALFSGCVFLISCLSSALSTLLKSSSLLPFAMAYLGIISLCLLLRFRTKLSFPSNLT